MKEIKRGDIFFANLGHDNVGSEQSGTRPILVIQNNIGNKFSPTIIVACITSKIFKNNIPTHVRLDKQSYGLSEDSLILCEQIKTLDKRRLGEFVTTLTPFDMIRVNSALKLSLGMN
jgi:mRNA interferase MazF